MNVRYPERTQIEHSAAAMNPAEKRSANPLVAFLDDAAAERGWRRETLSKMAGMSKDAIRSLENRGPRAHANLLTLQKFAAALGIDVNILLDVMPSKGDVPKAPRGPKQGDVAAAAVQIPLGLPMDLPVRGTVAGASPGSFHITEGIVQYVRRPPALMTVPDAYSLYVENDSMYPKFEQGDLVFAHPHRPLGIGDTMIIQIKAHEHAEIEGYIKIFKGRTADWVIGEQFNPAGTIRYSRDTVISTHRVLTLSELFGV